MDAMHRDHFLRADLPGVTAVARRMFLSWATGRIVKEAGKDQAEQNGTLLLAVLETLRLVI
jgi:hypothetical protein